MNELLAAYPGEFWKLTALMAPWLWVGFAVAGLFHALLPEAWIQRHLGRPGFGQVLKAVAIGVPLPLCSCGVIPVAAGLRRAGAGSPATAAFLASTPQTGVDSILATAALLGWPFAALRVAAAGVIGLLVGGLVGAFGGPEKAPSGPAGVPAARAPLRERLGDGLHFALVRLPKDLAGPLVIGLAVAAAMTLLLPPGALAWAAANPLLAYAAATLAAVPLYVCSTGSIPLAYALLAAGFPGGAALIFLIAGPATNAATVAAMTKLLGARATALYLAGLIGGAWAFGFAFDAWVTGALGGGAGHHHHEAAAAPGWLEHLAGAALLGLLAWALRPQPAAVKTTLQTKPGLRLAVGGMECDGCARKVHKALAAVPGVTEVAVDRPGGCAVVRGPALDAAALAASVNALGFEAGAAEPLR